MEIIHKEQSIALKELKNLKQKLDNREMSVLVGAGFSKNISSIFPSWWELLYDMTFFLYEKDIEESYQNLRSKKGKDKKQYFDDKIGYYINKVGYLDIVSDYIKRKGYREAISTYIEERTPKVIEKEGKKYIINKLYGIDNEIELTEEKLKLHKAIVYLPWNNIYTTNYDEMLETAVDSTSEKSLQEIKEKRKKEIDSIFKSINELKENKKNIDLEIQDSEKNQTDQSSTTSEPQIQEIQNPKVNESRYIGFQIDNLNRLIRKYEKELLEVHKALYECPNIITQSSQLSIKRNKNIIKLHGSLRNGKYGFDNDNRKQYVIAREDYDTYPQKHEAFTQLMKISLLQESYCLVGFSGVDPNFIEWIKWVRNIIEKNTDVVQYKIYLIEVDNNDDDKQDKRLFFENHKIFKIPLWQDETISFLQEETGIKIVDKTNRTELLTLFINYLSKNQYSYSQIYIDKNDKKIYQNIWNELKIYSPKDIDINAILEKYDGIISSYREYNRISNLSYAYNHNKEDLLLFAKKLFDDLKDNDSKQEKLFNLILIAIDDILLPIKNIWNNIELKYIEDKASKHNDIIQKINRLKLHNSVLELNKAEYENLSSLFEIKDDELIFEDILYSALNFEFSELNIKLTAWQTNSPHYIIKNAGLFALFSPGIAELYLEGKKDIFLKASIQEQFNYYQLIQYYNEDNIYNTDNKEKISEIIESFENEGFVNIRKTLKKLIQNDLVEKKEKIDRYGSGRFSFSHHFSFTKDMSKNEKGIQFLQLLLSFGLPLNVNNKTFINIEDWYIVFKLIYEKYPYPTLFYSLQYTDEKIIRRMAQDFIYSPHLIEEVNEILPKLLRTYLKSNTPHFYKKSILFFCSELFIAVKSKLWEDIIYKIWNLSNFQLYLFDSTRSEEYIFTIAALPYISDVKIFRRIIQLCLVNLEKKTSLEILYYLYKNPRFKKNKKIQNAEITKLVDEIISHLDKNEDYWYVIRFLHEILNDRQIVAVKYQLQKFPFDNINNRNTWGNILFYTEKKTTVYTLIKKAIINSTSLWNSGFNDDGSLSSGNYFIDLHSLEEDDSDFWTKEETEIIFKRLVQELVKIETWKLNRNDVTFESILQEMYWFLKTEKKNLKTINEYQSVLIRVIELYNKDKGYSTLYEGICSGDKSRVVWALSEISYLFYTEKQNPEINIILPILLNRILLQKEPAIEACLRYLCVWIEDNTNIEIFRPYFTIIVLILEKFYNEELPECDKPFVQKQLITISKQFKKFNVKNEIIKKWGIREIESRYYN